MVPLLWGRTTVISIRDLGLDTIEPDWTDPIWREPVWTQPS